MKALKRIHHDPIRHPLIRTLVYTPVHNTIHHHFNLNLLCPQKTN